jgi:hypothetical protein
LVFSIGTPFLVELTFPVWLESRAVTTQVTITMMPPTGRYSTPRPCQGNRKKVDCFDALGRGVISPVVVVAPNSTTKYFMTPLNDAGNGNPFSTTVYIDNFTAPNNCSIVQSPNAAVTPVTAGTTSC